ncbi:hypothetical protein Hanom_Chr07g00643061 [Helianthus anomalus]
MVLAIFFLPCLLVVEQMMNYKLKVIWWNKEYDGDVRRYGSGVTKK